MNKEILDKLTAELEDSAEIDCFGITFVDGELEETKCYRYNVKKEAGQLNDFCIAKDNDNCRKYFRIVPKEGVNYLHILKTFWKENDLNQSMEELEEIVTLLQWKNSCSNIRLTQLGIQNKGLDNRIIKSYFSLRKFESQTDIKGEKQDFQDLKGFFQEISERTSLSGEYIDVLEIVAKFAKEKFFYPSLMGINQFDDGFEYKVYYELFNYEDFFLNIETSSNEIIHDLCQIIGHDEIDMNYINHYFIENKFFLRGFAISDFKKQHNIVRLYFTERKRFE